MHFTLLSVRLPSKCVFYAFSYEDPQVLLIALRWIAEARGGITEVARRAGIERESLHRALSGRGNPRFSTPSAVAKAVGLRLTVEPV